MNTFFDYIFYRTTELFIRRSGRRGLPAISVISLAQGFMIGGVINLILNRVITKPIRELHYKEFGYFGAILFGLLFYINYRKYEGKYNKLRFKWKDEEPTKRFYKGLLVAIILILAPIIFTIVSNFLH